MRYKVLGKTGLKVSALGMGLMRLPIARINPDFEPAVKLICHALKRGITLFDVGTFYCHSHCETAFGLATAGISRDTFLLCGKNSTHQQSSLDWEGQLKNTLNLLQRDQLEIYFLHNLNFEDWQKICLKQSVRKQIEQSRAKGLYRYLGLSSHDKPENIIKLIDTDIFDVIILPYNLINGTYKEVMIYAHDRKLGVIAMNPLAGGALSKLDLFQDSDRIIDTQSALRYVASQPFIDSVLSGMETTAIIDQNVEAVCCHPYSAEDINVIEQAIHKQNRRDYIHCTLCNYCLPCPQGVPIAEIIEYVNQYSICKRDKIFSRDYSLLQITADCCIECGQCLDKCPNHLDVPQIMKKATRLFASI